MPIPIENELRLTFTNFPGTLEVSITDATFVLDTYGFGMGGPDLKTSTSLAHLILSDTVISMIMSPDKTYTGFIVIGMNLTGPVPTAACNGNLDKGTVMASWRGQQEPRQISNGLQLVIKPASHHGAE
jgi:hypothetical protein